MGQKANVPVGFREQTNLLRYQTSKELVALAPHQVRPTESLIKSERSTVRFVYLFRHRKSPLICSFFFTIWSSSEQFCQVILIFIARTTFTRLASDFMLFPFQWSFLCQVFRLCVPPSAASHVQVPATTVPQRPLSVDVCTLGILAFCLFQTKLLMVQTHFVVCSSATQTISDTVTQKSKENYLTEDKNLNLTK